MKKLLFFLMAIIFAIQTMGQITTFPWTESFDSAWTTNAPGNGTSPANWININGGSSTTPLWRKCTSATRIRTGSGSAEMYGGNSQTATSTYFHSDWLITPQFTLTGGQSLSFYLYSNESTVGNYTQDMSIYIYNVNTNGHDVVSLSDTSLFTVIMPSQILQGSTTANWAEFEINLSQYTGNYRIALVRNKLKGGYYLNIDDLKVDATPNTCPNTRRLTSSVRSTTEVDLNWDIYNSNGSGWQIVYGDTLNFDTITSPTITLPSTITMPYTLNNLMPLTTYKFAVRQNCTGAWSNIVTSSTPAMSTLLPYYTDFENAADNQNWQFINGTQINKWYIGSAAGVNTTFNGTNGLFISNDNGLTNAHIGGTANLSRVYAHRDFEIPAGTQELALTFDWKALGGSINSDFLRVYWVPVDLNITAGSIPPNGYDISAQIGNYTGGFGLNRLNQSSVFQDTIMVINNIQFPNLGGRTWRLVMHWRNESTTTSNINPPAVVDNLSLSVITCNAPRTIFTSNITTTSADISWTSIGLASSFWLFYKPIFDTIWDSVYVSTLSPYSLQNLIPNTSYTYYIKADCGTEKSLSSISQTFRTLCNAISTLPYTEKFDSYGTGSGILPFCWYRNSTVQTSPYINTTNFSTPGALYFNNALGSRSVAICNPIDSTIPINTLRVKFNMYFTSTTYPGLQIGVMTDPSDWSTFTPIGTMQSVTEASQWEEKEVSLAPYTGLGRYIAIASSGAINYAYVDNFIVDYIPACAKPTNLVVSNISTSGADLTWTPGNVGDNAWYLYYKQTNSSNWDSVYISINNTFSFTNLTQATFYRYYITTICGTGISEPTPIKSFRSACGEMSTFPYYENFDTYGTGTATYPIPTCWTRNSTSSNSPFINTTNYTPPGSLYLSSGASGRSVIILRKIDTTINVNTLMLKFKIYHTTTSYQGIQIGVMTDPSDWTTFIPVGALQKVTTANTWLDKEVSLATYTGIGRYIAISVNGFNSCYLDNLIVDLIPACAKPTTVGASNIATTSAAIGWTVASVSDNTWKISYKKSTDLNWDTLVTTTNPTTLNNLSDNCLYNVEVRTQCSNGSYSDAIIFDFRTACNKISTIPYYENFDSYGVGGTYPYCWTKYSGYNASYPNISTTYFSSPGSLYFYAYNNQQTVAIVNAIDSTIPLNTLRIKFKMYYFSTSYHNIQVGVMTSPTDYTTFVPVDNVQTVSVGGQWEDKEISFASYTGTGKYIAFSTVAPINAFNYGYIDNVVIDYIPACAKPTSINISPLTTSSTFSWTTGNPTDSAWWIYYKVDSSLVYDSVHVISLPYILQGLNPNTTYNYYVVTDCGILISPPTVPNSFKTSCNPIVGSISLPWNEGFENIATTNQLPNCWSSTNLGSNTYTQLSDYSSNNRVAHSGTKSAYFDRSCNDVFYSPGFDLIAGQKYTFSYWYITDGIIGWTSLGAGVYTNQYDTSSFIQNVGNPLSNVQNTTYQQYVGEFTPITNGVYYFGVKCQSASTPWYLTIDDLKLEALNCNIPDSVSLTNVMPTSVDMNWNAGSSTSWLVEYKTTSSSSWNSFISNTNSFSFTGLIPQTSYQFRVATLCGGDTSLFINLNLTTPCNAITTLPYTESFENYGFGTGAYPTCWNKFSQYSTNYPHISSSFSSSPYGSLYFYSYNNQQTYAIFGPIDNSISVDTLRVKFKMYYSSIGHHNLQVGVMTNPYDVTTFVPIDSVQSVTVAGVWQDKEVLLASYSGIGRYIAFGTVAPAGTYNFGYLDDVVVDYISGCSKPTNLTISNITSTSADISWINGNNSAWWIYYKPNALTLYDSIHITTQSPFTIPNLIHSTLYDYYIKTDCFTELSEPTLVNSFYTACAPISTFPWFEDFETSWIPKSGLSNEAQPTNCWTNINGGSYYDYKWQKTTSIGIPAFQRTGTGSVQLNGENNMMGDYLITPTFTLTGNQKIIFWAKGYTSSTSYPENLWLKAFDETTNGALDSISDTTLFTTIGFINDTNQYTWKEYEFPLTGLVGDYRLVFARDNSVGYYFQIDDLKIDNLAACPRPNTVNVSNIQQTQATISWLPSSLTDNAWKIFYRPMGSLTWDSVYTTSNPNTLINLIASTAYEVEVKTYCGTGVFSDGRGARFMTACGAMTIPTAIENFVTVLPNICWSRYIGQLPTIGNATLASTANGWTANTNVTNHNVKLNLWTTNQNYWLVTPSVDLGAGSSLNKVEFDLFLTAFNNSNIPSLITGYSDKKLYVLISTDDGLTWTRYNTLRKWDNAGSVDTLNKLTNVPLHVTIPLVDTANNPYSGIVKFAFYGESTVIGVGNNDLHIDNFQVTGPVCAVPTALTTSGITQTAATVSWTPGANETSWEVKLGSAGSATNVTTPTYNFTGLTHNTIYTAYIRSSCGAGFYSYWVPISFTTLIMPSNPTVTTSSITTITHNTAILVGSYSQGVDTVNAVGFEYKVDTATIWTNQAVSLVASPFSYNAVGLTPSTQYKVRAYATTNAGNFYGDTVTFTTAVFNAPTVTTDPVTNITSTTATFNGTTAQGTESIVARGFEYKTNAQTWTSALDVTATGSTTITANVTGLVNGTNYDVRAYAETASGKTYGSEVSFIAGSPVVLGEVTTLSTTNIDTTSATLNGSLVNVGGATSSIEVGFVYSTITNPVIDGANVIKTPVSYTTGMTTYNTNITGLTPQTPYYVKSYVTNAAGTAYGQEMTFTTLSGLNDIEVNTMSVSLYPNPASTTSTLVVKGLVGGAKVIITDVQGRTINTFTMKSINGEATKSINVNEFAKGVYYLRIQNVNTISTQKLIIR